MRDERKNTRPEAATSGRAERESAWTGGNSRSQHTTAADGGQGVVSSLLMEGRSNALHLADLVRLTGWPERDVRKAIQRERKAGMLILSDCQHGYFLPEGEEDVRRFILSMSRRSREIAMVSRAAEDALARMAGQERVVGW